jgi:hypothetical protein
MDEIKGKNFDFSCIKNEILKPVIPLNREFIIQKVYNRNSNKTNTLLICTFKGCKRAPFGRWHNFLDHIRIHTKEMPFGCLYEECSKRFS